jgi:hypothetical protein
MWIAYEIGTVYLSLSIGDVKEFNKGSYRVLFSVCFQCSCPICAGTLNFLSIFGYRSGGFVTCVK